MPLCSAINCTNAGVHPFPTNEKLRKLWEKALKRKKFSASKFSRLCQSHFKKTDYIGESIIKGKKWQFRYLNEDAIPTIFTNTKLLVTVGKVEGKSKGSLRVTQDLLTPVFSTVSDNEDLARSNREIKMEIADASEDFDSIAKPIQSLNVNPNYYFIEVLKSKSESIDFYTGLESYEKFQSIYLTLCPAALQLKYKWSEDISVEDQLFLSLMKLRRNKTDYELSLFFGVSESTVYKIVITWMNLMSKQWGKLNIWPEKEIVDYFMPEQFKSTRIIIDGSEYTMRKLKDPNERQSTWSQYKNGNTQITLDESLKVNTASVSYRQTVGMNDSIHKCEENESDRRFTEQEVFASENFDVNIPLFLKDKSQLPGITLLQEQKLARKREYIERLIGLTKAYKILTSDLNQYYEPMAYKIFAICITLCIFRQGIMK